VDEDRRPQHDYRRQKRFKLGILLRQCWYQCEADKKSGSYPSISWDILVYWERQHPLVASEGSHRAPLLASWGVVPHYSNYLAYNLFEQFETILYIPNHLLYNYQDCKIFMLFELL
jgi:hypothetical protein